MAASMREPAVVVVGKPVFDASAPALRVNGRKLSNGWADLETLWAGIGVSLYGFRAYPIEPLRAVMRGQRWMRRFDFDPEAVVRMCWRGVRPINLPAPVKYFRASKFRLHQALDFGHRCVLGLRSLRPPRGIGPRGRRYRAPTPFHWPSSRTQATTLTVTSAGPTAALGVASKPHVLRCFHDPGKQTPKKHRRSDSRRGGSAKIPTFGDEPK